MKMVVPVMSEGRRSGVNCMRQYSPESERARERASMVLPTPGTSSISRCPPLIRAITASSTSASFPLMTRRTLSARARARWHDASKTSPETMKPPIDRGRFLPYISSIGAATLRDNDVCRAGGGERRRLKTGSADGKGRPRHAHGRVKRERHRGERCHPRLPVRRCFTGRVRPVPNDEPRHVPPLTYTQRTGGINHHGDPRPPRRRSASLAVAGRARRGVLR